MKLNRKLSEITLAAAMAALICVSTLIVRIPSPTNGYLNLGDCFVNLSGWLLGPVYGTAAAGIGSALSDLISGYPLYIPATLVIKALMALVSYMIYAKLLMKKKGNFHLALIVSSAVSEILMVAGYYAYEALAMGLGQSALAGIPSNLIQGAAGCLAGVAVAEILGRVSFFRKIFNCQNKFEKPEGRD